MTMKKLPIILAALLAFATPVAAQVTNGKATTAAPTYTNNTINPLSLDTAGNLRVIAASGGSAQPVNITQTCGVTLPADDAAAAGCPLPVGGVYNSTLPTYTNLDRTQLQFDSRGELIVGGSVASGTTDLGNPVKVGGIFTSTAPTLTNGQRGDIQINQSGALIIATRGSIIDGIASTGSYLNNNVSGAAAGNHPLLTMPLVFNGSTWDREFTCPNSAVVNVTAAATTQLVALSGSTNIRVCSVAITMSAAGTAQFVSGTGANCGTGTANVTGAFTLATGTPLALSAANGSLFRAGASNALCLAAVTGNVTGVISYAQF